jgi:hypothetical protein
VSSFLEVLVCFHTHYGYNFIQDHVEGYLALSGKTKTYFATAVSLWDADFYVKVDDDVHVNIGKSPCEEFYVFCRS